MQVSVPDTGCNVPYDIWGVRGQIRYQKKQKKENQSKCEVDIRCMRPDENSGRINVLSTRIITGEDKNGDECETKCNITDFGSRHMKRLTLYFAFCFQSTK